MCICIYATRKMHAWGIKNGRGKVVNGLFHPKLRIVKSPRNWYSVVNTNPRKETHMVRREKGFKRYAGQRERRFTDPLIREGEIEQVRNARRRIARAAEAEINIEIKEKGK